LKSRITDTDTRGIFKFGIDTDTTDTGPLVSRYQYRYQNFLFLISLKFHKFRLKLLLFKMRIVCRLLCYQFWRQIENKLKNSNVSENISIQNRFVVVYTNNFSLVELYRIFRGWYNFIKQFWNKNFLPKTRKMANMDLETFVVTNLNSLKRVMLRSTIKIVWHKNCRMETWKKPQLILVWPINEKK
jgi:hypothetical protein